MHKPIEVLSPLDVLERLQTIDDKDAKVLTTSWGGDSWNLDPDRSAAATPQTYLMQMLNRSVELPFTMVGGVYSIAKHGIRGSQREIGRTIADKYISLSGVLFGPAGGALRLNVVVTHETFMFDVHEGAEATKSELEVVAEGLFRYLNATDQELAASKVLEESIKKPYKS